MPEETYPIEVSEEFLRKLEEENVRGISDYEAKKAERLKKEVETLGKEVETLRNSCDALSTNNNELKTSLVTEHKKSRRGKVGSFLLGLAIAGAGGAAYALWHPHTPPPNPPQESPVVRSLTMDNATYQGLLQNLTDEHRQYFDQNATWFDGNLTNGEMISDYFAIHANNSAQNIYMIETKSTLGISNFDLIFGKWAPPETVAYVESLLGDSGKRTFSTKDHAVTIKRIPYSSSPKDFKTALESLVPEAREAYLSHPELLDIHSLAGLDAEEQREAVKIADHVLRDY